MFLDLWRILDLAKSHKRIKNAPSAPDVEFGPFSLVRTLDLGMFLASGVVDHIKGCSQPESETFSTSGLTLSGLFSSFQSQFHHFTVVGFGEARFVKLTRERLFEKTREVPLLRPCARRAASNDPGLV